MVEKERCVKRITRGNVAVVRGRVYEMRKKGSGTFCRNGPKGATHKRYPTHTRPLFSHPRERNPQTLRVGCTEPSRLAKSRWLRVRIRRLAIHGLTP